MKKTSVIFCALLFTLTAVLCTVFISKNSQKAEAVAVDYSDYVNSPSWDHDYVHIWNQGDSIPWNYATETIPPSIPATNNTITTTKNFTIPGQETTKAEEIPTEIPATTLMPETTTMTKPATVPVTESTSSVAEETTTEYETTEKHSTTLIPETTTAEYATTETPSTTSTPETTTMTKPATVPATKPTTAPELCYGRNHYNFKAINSYPPVVNEDDYYDPDTLGTTRVTESAEGDTITGTYEKLSWTFDVPSGVLRIDGSGVVKETYKFKNLNFGEVKKIIIGNGITELDSSSFMCTENLTDVIISDTVEIIGDYAFAWCHSLKNVKLGSNLVSLGESAFKHCKSLERIEIPDNVRKIEEKTFFNCTKLGKVVLGENITEIGNYAFASCSSLKEIVFSENLKTISASAFKSCIALYEVSIPDNVESIGIRAFYDCINLKKISIGNGIRNIGAHAFCNTGYYLNPDNWENDILYLDNCLLEAKNINYENFSIKEGTKVIGGMAFWITTPNSVYIPESVKGISDEAFANCGANSINIPESVEYIGILAFVFEPELKGGAPLEISANVKKIGEGAFANRNITEFVVDENNPNYSSDEYGVLYSKDMKKLIAFPDKAPLKGFTIPDSVKEISDWAFAFCNLNNIVIPESVEKIGYGAFSVFRSLSELILPDNLKELGDNVVSDSVITLLDTGNGITDINIYAHEIKQIKIGKSIENLQSSASEKYIVNPENEYFSSDEQGVLYDKEKTIIVRYPRNSSVEHYVMPSTVVCSVYPDLSISSPALKTITFSENFYSKNYISDHKYLWEFSPFSNYTAEKFIMPEANPLFCTDENGVIFSKNKEFLYKYPSKKSNEEYTVPEGVKIIASHAFYYCDSLKKITVPDNVIIIGSYAFYGCQNLGEIDIPDNPIIICEYAFYGTEYYFDINNWYNNCFYIGNHMIFVATGVFDDGEWGNVYLKEGTIDTASGAFGDYGSYPILNVYIPKSVKFISPEAFQNSNNLRNVYYSGSQEEWESIQIVYKGNHNLFDTVIYCNATYIPSAPDPSPEIIVDENTGVSIEIDSSKYDGEVEIAVEENIDDNSAFDIISTETEIENFALYDIKMTIDGAEIQPLEKVTVRLPLPENFDPTRTIVFHVNTLTGKLEQMNARYEDGFMVFETDHFSYYAIVEESTVSDEPIIVFNQEDVMLYYKHSTSVSAIASEGKIVYTSSDPDTVSVDENGNITAGKTGSAVIIATVEGTDTYATCNVTVTYAWWQWIIRILLLGFLWY